MVKNYSYGQAFNLVAVSTTSP